MNNEQRHKMLVSINMLMDVSSKLQSMDFTNLDPVTMNDFLDRRIIVIKNLIRSVEILFNMTEDA